MQLKLQILADTCLVLANESQDGEIINQAITARNELENLSSIISGGSMDYQDSKIIQELITDKIKKLINKIQYNNK